MQFSYPISNILQSAVLEGPPPDRGLTNGQLLHLEVTQKRDSPGPLPCGHLRTLLCAPLQCVLTFTKASGTTWCRVIDDHMLRGLKRVRATAVSSELTRLHVQLQLPYAGWGLMNLTASGLETWSLTKQPLGYPVNQVGDLRHCLSAIKLALAKAASAKLAMAAKTACLRDSWQ